MRLSWLWAAAALAVLAGVLGLSPLFLRHHPGPPQLWRGTTTVYAVPLAGGDPRPVVRLRNQWAFPLATADGKALLIERPLLVGTQLWRVPLGSGRRTLVKTVATLRAPAVANHGFVAQEQLVRPASGWRVELTVRRAGRLVWRRQTRFPVGAAAAGPDGRTVAVVRMHLLELVTPTTRHVLARDIAGAYAPLWERDGRHVLCWTTGGRLVEIDIGGASRRVVVSGLYFDAALSADGRTVYVLGRKDAVSIPK